MLNKCIIRWLLLMLLSSLQMKCWNVHNKFFEFARNALLSTSVLSLNPFYFTPTLNVYYFEKTQYDRSQARAFYLGLKLIRVLLGGLGPGPKGQLSPNPNMSKYIGFEDCVDQTTRQTWQVVDASYCHLFVHELVAT